MDIRARLFELQDLPYREFGSKLVPNVSKEQIIGIRLPNLRNLAKTLKNEDYADFMKESDHEYLEERQLQRLIIENIKDYETMLKELEHWLPMVDCWSVCDGFNNKAIKKNLDDFIKHIKRWLKSKRVYTRRFGLTMLMAYYLDDSFKSEYLDLAAEVETNGEYYLEMMKGWYFATALAKQWDSTIKIIESNILDIPSHNKAIRKAIESFRVSDEHKTYLRTLKR